MAPLCTRCGQSDHRTRDCLGERTRPEKSKRSEISTFDAKRDLWRDFDEAEDFEKVAAEFVSPDPRDISVAESEISPEMRTLRQRSDVAAYLRRDVSGSYNPKTHAMISDSAEFVRGGVDEVARLRNVASEIGNFADVANPTEAEILFRAVERRKLETSEARKRKLAEVYESSQGEHSEIFGSFFDSKSLRWGYACCRVLDRSSLHCPASSP